MVLVVNGDGNKVDVLIGEKMEQWWLRVLVDSKDEMVRGRGYLDRGVEVEVGGGAGSGSKSNTIDKPEYD